MSDNNNSNQQAPKPAPQPQQSPADISNWENRPVNSPDGTVNIRTVSENQK